MGQALSKLLTCINLFNISMRWAYHCTNFIDEKSHSQRGSANGRADR